MSTFASLLESWPQTDGRWADVSKTHHDMIKTIIHEVDRLRKEVEKLSNENNDLKTKLNQQPPSPPGSINSGEIWSRFLNKTRNEKSDEEIMLVAQISKESKEKSQIEKNIIISGLAKEGADNNEIAANDKAKVEKVLKALGTRVKIEDVKRISRISNADGNRDLKMIKVELKTTESKSIICVNALKLRSNKDFDNIYVNEDKTKAERMLDKKLRDEKKRLTSEMTEKDEHGRQCATQNGKKYYWRVRAGVLERVYTK
jgi:hypothetical protein